MVNNVSPKLQKSWLDFAVEVTAAVVGAIVLALVVVAVVCVATMFHVVAYACKLCFTLNFRVMLKKVNWTRVLTEIVLLIAAVLGGAYNSETIMSLL